VLDKLDLRSLGIRVLCVKLHATRPVHEAVETIERIRSQGYQPVHCKRRTSFTFVGHPADEALSIGDIGVSCASNQFARVDIGELEVHRHLLWHIKGKLGLQRRRRRSVRTMRYRRPAVPWRSRHSDAKTS
jgi:hypothetical protein